MRKTKNKYGRTREKERAEYSDPLLFWILALIIRLAVAVAMNKWYRLLDR